MKQLLGIPSDDFKIWLKAYCLNRQTGPGWDFKPLEGEGYFFQYCSQKRPLIALEIYVEPLSDQFIRVRMKPSDRPNIDVKATKDFILELNATAIEEEISLLKPFKNKSSERQLVELGVLELVESKEINIILFLKEYHKAWQNGATIKELLEIRCKYLAAQGEGGLVYLLRERQKERNKELYKRQQESLQALLKKFSEEYEFNRQKEAKYAGSAPLNLLDEIEEYKEAIELIKQTQKGEVDIDELQPKLHQLHLIWNEGIDRILKEAHGVS